MMSLDEDEGLFDEKRVVDSFLLSSSYYAQPLCSSRVQPRQFEFHPRLRIMAVGTCEGDVVILDWEKNKILHRRVFNESEKRRERRSILALSWLKKNPRLLLAGSSSGMAKLYRLVDEGLDVAMTYGDSPLTEEMTSIHCNCLDQLLVTSGYTNNVKIFDVNTGRNVREYERIHEDHINICRFANNLPDILLTCSFDNTIKLWDNRCSSQRPIHTSKSEGGNVMVCFSPDDMYFLASAVDNEVKQYSTVDGRLNLRYNIKPIGSSINYTRSYYANDGDLVVSGSSNDDMVHICCSRTGNIIKNIRMYEGRRHPNLYIQSLRGNPIDSNRFGVLVCYRYSDGYEVVDVDLNRCSDGKRRSLPYSLAAEAKLAADFKMQINSTQFYDLELVSADGKRIRAHRAMIYPRWGWFRSNVKRLQQISAYVARMRFSDLEEPILQTVLHFIYTGQLMLHTSNSSNDANSDTKIRRTAELTYFRCKPDRYQLPRLCELIECYFRERMTLNNAIATLKFACAAGAQRLYKSCRDFISRCLQFYESTMGYDLLNQSIGTDNFRTILTQKIQSRHIPKSTSEPYFKGRTAHTTCQVGRWVYLLGGYYSKGTQDLRCVPVFDTLLLEWTLLPTYGVPTDIPEKLCFHSAVAVDDYLLAFGGGLKDDFRNELHFLDLRTMTWKKFQTTGKTPCERKRHSAVAIGNEMWVFGGRIRGVDNKQMSNELYKFDMATKHWSEVTTHGQKPMGRCGHTMTFLPNAKKLLIIGGFTCVGLVETQMVHALDLETMRWEEIKTPSPRPAPRCCHTATLFQMNGQLHVAVFGGSTSAQYSVNGNQYLQDIWLLSVGSPGSSQGWCWRKLEVETEGDPIPPRFTHSAFLSYSANLGDSKHGEQVDASAAVLSTATKSKGNDPGMRGGSETVYLSDHGELDTKKRHRRLPGSMDLGIGSLTIWAGGNSVDFLDDMWHLENNSVWKRTRYAVCGSLPEPVFHSRPTAVSQNMKTYFLQPITQCFLSEEDSKPNHRHSSEIFNKADEGKFSKKYKSATEEASRNLSENLPSSHAKLSGEQMKGKSRAVMDDKMLGFGDKKHTEEGGLRTPVSGSTSIDISFAATHEVTLVVEGRYVRVSKAILAARSSQFRTMFTSKMRESRERIIQLPDLSLRAFLVILYYLYTGDIPTNLTPTMHKLIHSGLKAWRGVEGNSPAKIRWPVTIPEIWATANAEQKKPEYFSSKHNQRLERVNSRKRKGASNGTPSKIQRSQNDEFLTPCGPKVEEGHVQAPEYGLKPCIGVSKLSGTVPMDCQDLKQVLSHIEIVSSPTVVSDAGSKNADGKERSRFLDPLEIIVVADRFALDHLRDLMEVAVGKHLTVENVCGLLRFAHYYTLKRLLNCCVMHVITHYEELVGTEEFKNMEMKLRSVIENRYRKLQPECEAARSADGQDNVNEMCTSSFARKEFN